MTRRERRIRILVLSALACVVAYGCAKYQPHPGSVNTFDSKTYDTLNTSQAALDQAKKEYASGQLSGDTAKAVINKAGDVYNVTRDAWLEYRGLVSAGKDATAVVAKIEQDIPQLISAINDVKALARK